jgi:hypothetical protein
MRWNGNNKWIFMQATQLPLWMPAKMELLFVTSTMCFRQCSCTHPTQKKIWLVIGSEEPQKVTPLSMRHHSGVSRQKNYQLLIFGYKEIASSNLLHASFFLPR